MDSLNFQNIKLEKANAMLRYRRLQKITTMFRFMELFVFLIIVSRFPTQMPFFSKLSGEYFKGVSDALFSPRSVFVVGNVIILILFLKSGHFGAKNSPTNMTRIDFYDEYMENCRVNQNICKNNELLKKPREKKATWEEKHVVYHHKYNPEEKKMQRSHSEHLERIGYQQKKAEKHELRRSITEKCRKNVNNSKKLIASYYPEDEMSNEEFRRTVEAFIARQQRFLREEEFSSVVSYAT